METKIETLLSEKKLAKALGVSVSSLLKLRWKGCPYLRIGGRIFYQEQELMTWILENCKRTSDEERQASVKHKNDTP